MRTASVPTFFPVQGRTRTVKRDVIGALSGLVLVEGIAVHGRVLQTLGLVLLLILAILPG